MPSLYQKKVLEHWRHPHNFGKIASPHKKSSVCNPSCGDEIRLELLFDKNKVKEAKFTGRGCAICLASGSLFTDYLRGKNEKALKNISKETVLSLLGVKISPARSKCALLPLEALKKII